MKFTCTKENLLKAINTTMHLAVKNIQLPILNNVYIRASNSQVEFSSTNLEAATRAVVRAMVAKDGVFTLPARTLADAIILNDAEKFEFDLKDNGECVVLGGKSKIVIKGTAADEYPVIPPLEDGEKFEIDGLELKDCLEQTTFSTARNEIRPELSGVFMKVESALGLVVFAATDSFRLAERKAKIAGGPSGEKTAIIPARSALEIIRILALQSEPSNVTVLFSDTQLSVSTPDASIVTRLIEGKYPDYTQIIPSQFKTKILLDRAEFMKKIKAAGMFSTGGVNAISLSAEQGTGTILLEAAHAQLGNYDSSFEAEVSGESQKIALNFRYLLDGLNALPVNADKITLELSGAETPCLLKAQNNKTFLYIIMPIRQ